MSETDRKTQPIPSTMEVVDAKAANPDLYPSHASKQTTITPADMLALAKSGSLEMVEKMMDLQDRWEKAENKKKFVAAMAAFKATPPTIVKTGHVGFKSKKPGAGVTDYDHATLGEIVPLIVSALSEHGLHHNWYVEQPEGNIKVTCVITHKDGHSDSTSWTAKSDTTGNKNAIQAMASTATYLQRYTLLALTGLAAQDQDDDGIAAGAGTTISVEQLATIRDLLVGLNNGESRLKTLMGVESIDQIPAGEFSKATGALQQAIKVQNEKAKKEKAKNA